ncbi:hypothetical protein ACVRW7_00325 [Streptococcus ratti]|uniref:Uncharacterized protein n=1 Tax=Streptococcus ratti FA-1 = DSM 20564 TaxID=699248 RepID=A0ABN0GUF5_STRRT|nr:hypothetical protein [Streptococcus ratti]EJN93950.1 hypothetical protein SRA_05411 [Streptococcus ratti FA-1 = DSM 20564]EMP69640.1 hypothetical protein D822_07173 [Streptococcus ratti FA-1 = DSM 20564]QEY07791.1 hypothetical protein FY406_09105 [Streptococcus ratti]VEI60259.1 Uncharacterised protein [Streptococcus mutans]
MAGQQLKNDKLQTRKKQTQEEVLKNKIDRLKTALEQENDPKLRKEILLLLQEYERSYKTLLQKKRFLNYLLAAAAAIGVIIIVLVFLFLKDSSTSTALPSQESHRSAASTEAKESKRSKTSTTRSSREDRNEKDTAVFPQSLLDTWSGYISHMQSDVKMTFTEDGTVKTLIDSNSYTSQVSSLEKVGNNTYLYHLAQGSEVTALVPGAQLGGVDVKYAYGIYIGEDYIIPLVWQTRSNAEFDYSKPLKTDSDYRLTKGASSQQSSKSNKNEDPQVDTKNLTTQQVEDWVIAHYLDSLNDNRFTKDDYIIESWKAETDGLVYAVVRENHDTDAMKKAGADPNVSPAVARYRINAKGELEKSSDGAGIDWTVVSKTYYSH